MKNRIWTRAALSRVTGSQCGAAAVEMAILLPLLLLLIFGSIEFGVYLYNQQVLTNASREGARAGIVQRTPRLSEADITGIVSNYASGRLITFGNGGTEPGTDVSWDGQSFGDTLTVTATYQYSFFVVGNIIGLFGGSFDNARAMSATTVMRYE